MFVFLMLITVNIDNTVWTDLFFLIISIINVMDDTAYIFKRISFMTYAKVDDMFDTSL